MRYDPKDTCYPEAWYDAELSAVEGVSKKSGNPMLILSAKIYHGQDCQVVREYYVEGQRSSLTKLAKLSKAIGHNFDCGEITPADITGKNCKLYIKIHDDPEYGKQNKISQYAAISDDVSQAPKPQPGSEEEVPF